MSEPAAGHLDFAALAELDEGLLGGAAADAARAHLAECPSCRSMQEHLAATRSALAALPDEPMPTAVSARLDAALRGAAGTATVVPAQAAAVPFWRRPTAAGLAAAAAVAALVAGVVVGTTRHHDKARPLNEAAAGAGAVQRAAAAANFPVTSSGQQYTPVNAPTLVAGLLKAKAAPLASGAGGTAASPNPSPLTLTNTQVPDALAPLESSRAAILRCVAALRAGEPFAAPIHVDFGVFTNRPIHVINQPAMILLLPADKPTFDEAWIVGPNCATAPDNNLYLYQQVPAQP
ncbi:MAG: hypothetical protein JO222_02680 [Frankiales bacterium]|nr:hypothetical protein [Frankiales bacterium]